MEILHAEANQADRIVEVLKVFLNEQNRSVGFLQAGDGEDARYLITLPEPKPEDPNAEAIEAFLSLFR